MGLSRLENFLKSVRGTVLYVNPNDLDATDSIDNQGNSLTRPFRTIQRALIEAARFSYQRGLNNDRFGKTTILVYPGDHVVDNRPGWIPDGADNFRLRNGQSSTNLVSFDAISNFDLESPDNDLYKLNSIHGGVIIPRGTSLVGLDLRKTKIRPKYVPNPSNDNIERSAVFRVTGGCYFWQFSMFDADPNGQCYIDYTNNLFSSNFSHHKLTCFEYADGVNPVSIKDTFYPSGLTYNRTDLDMYYEKISIAYGPASGRAIDPDYPSTIDVESKVDEYRIVGSTGLSVGITSIRAGNGSVSNTTITVDIDTAIDGLEVDTPFRVEGVTDAGYNGQFVVVSKLSSTQLTYSVESAPVVPLPNPTGATLSLSSDTVTSASPYIFNISLRSVYGMCGVLADGNKASGFKSMVIAQFTGIGLQKDDNAFVVYDERTGTYQDNSVVGNETISTNPRAVYKPSYRNFHIKCINDAFIQNVSIFAIGYAEHFSVESGGDQSVTNSNSNFGSKALVASGFRKNAFPQDDLGYITHIIPPKELPKEEASIEFSAIDVNRTVGVGTTNERLYLYNETNQNIPPENVLDGYRIGAKQNDLLNVLISVSGISTEYSSRIVMPNSQTSSEKFFYVDRNGSGANRIGGNSLGGAANVITLIQPHTFENGETIRVISENGQLPDGITPNTVYYAITDANATSGLTTSVNIKLAKTLNDAKTANAVDINSNGGVLSIVSRVSDKSPGDIGHPIQYDTSLNQWYIKVSTSSTDNTIHPRVVGLGTTSLGEATSRTYIKRKKYNRNANDSIYRVRYVIPAATGGRFSRPPGDGFIIQESNTSIGSTTGEIQTYFGSGSLGNINQQRNFRFIANATWESSNNTANIVTEIPHNLRVGSQVELVNIKSTNNSTGVGNSGFNGTYNVVGISSAKQFAVGLSTDPGTFTNDTTTRNTALPYFKKKRYNNTYYIYRNQEAQKYIAGKQDGIYYLTLVNSSNAPTVAPFTEEKYSQPVKELYPQIDRDNPVSDPSEAKSFASSSTIGEVIVNDVRNSITKETVSKILSDTDIGVGINNIISDTASSHTVYTTIDHGLNRVIKVGITSAGAGYGSGAGGALYNARLVGFAGSITGQHATAKITANASGSITDVVIMDGGSAYGIGNTLAVVGVATTSGFVQAVVTVTQVYNNVNDVVRISGVSSVSYQGYNDLYRITDVAVGAANSFTVSSASSISGFSTTGVGAVLTQNALAYLTGQSLPVSDIQYNNVTGFATVIVTNNHGFSVGNKIRLGGANEEIYNGDFVVTQNVGLTSFVVNVGVGTTAVNETGTIFVYPNGVTSNDGAILPNFENISGRMVSNYAGITTTLRTGIDTEIIESISITGIDKLDIRIGDYLQIDEELVRVKTTVPNSIGPTDTINVFRGVLGTRATRHLIGSVVRRVYVNPVELRRHSIIRASGHTFEYVGFGPGNYSTALPDKQTRQISAQEELLAQSTRREGGINFYTGMNDKGISYSGNKKLSTVTGQEEIFDTPVQTVTGEDIGNQPSLNVINPIEGTFGRSIRVEGGTDGNSLSEFNGPVVFNEKVSSTSPKGFEVNSLLLQGDVTVSRRYTIGNSKPTIAGNPGDVQYNANPTTNGYVGWVYTSNNEWQEFGKIGIFFQENVIGVARSSNFVGLSTLIDFVGPGIVTTQYSSAGITTLVFGQQGTGVSVNSTQVGNATQLDFTARNLTLSSQYNVSSGIATINIVGLGSTDTFRGQAFIKEGATETNFLKAGGADSPLTFGEVTDALGFVPANSAAVIDGNYPQGNSLIVDSIDIAAGGGPFDGVKTDFLLKINGNVYIPPGSAANLVVSLGGVIQKPGSDFTILESGGLNTDTIRFTTPPPAGISHFIVALGGQGALLSDISWNNKGDIVAGLSVNNAAIVGVGTDGTFLEADSTLGVGVTWRQSNLTTSTGVNKTLVNHEFCSVYTSGLTISLPASPKPGWYVSINIAGTFTNTTIDRNGSLLMGLAENMIIDAPYTTVKLVYSNASILDGALTVPAGWRIS